MQTEKKRSDAWDIAIACGLILAVVLALFVFYDMGLRVLTMAVLIQEPVLVKIIMLVLGLAVLIFWLYCMITVILLLVWMALRQIPALKKALDSYTRFLLSKPMSVFKPVQRLIREP